MKSSAEMENIVESLVDENSVKGVLLALSSVCSMKAEHLLENWQDEGLAQDWEKASDLLDKIANYYDIEVIS